MRAADRVGVLFDGEGGGALLEGRALILVATDAGGVVQERCGDEPTFLKGDTSRGEGHVRFFSTSPTRNPEKPIPNMWRLN